MAQSFTLTPHSPYNFNITLELLRRHIHPVINGFYDGSYWRVLHIKDGLVLLRVTSVGDVESPALNVEIVANTGEISLDDIKGRIAHILGVDVDPTSFYEMAREDALLWSVIEPLYGLRWLRTDSVYEALMMIVIEQQIAWTAAQRAEGWLVEWGGHFIDNEGQRFYAFPTPMQIATATIEDLKPLKITFKRMQVMIDISKQIVESSLDIEAVRDLSHDEAYRHLLKINGVGHWTAAWTLQRAVGQQRIVGDNDVALQAAVNAYFYGGEGKIPAERVRETFAPYGDFAGLAAQYTLLRWVLDRYPVQH